MKRYVTKYYSRKLITIINMHEITEKGKAKDLGTKIQLN